MRLVLNFVVGLEAVTGDLSQFYYSFKLKPEQWNLQRFLWKEDLDPNSPVEEGIIGALIWGVACVSGQTETGMDQLADLIEDKYPLVAMFLRRLRYVDDLSKSAQFKEELKRLTQDTETVLQMVGLTCKAWVFSGEAPPDKVSVTEGSVKVAGQRWRPLVDTIEIPVPGLHFGKKQRGKLSAETEIFTGTFEDLEKFTPKKLTRKHVASKLGSWYDLLGKFAPLMGAIKLDLRRTMQHTENWNDAMPDFLRNRWIKDFWVFEQLRGIQFTRARMPLDAVRPKMRIITIVDAADEIIIIGVWCGFLRKNGTWSCQLLIGRCLLADFDDTMPHKELNAFCFLLKNVNFDTA